MLLAHRLRTNPRVQLPGFGGISVVRLNPPVDDGITPGLLPYLHSFPVLNWTGGG